MNMPVYPMPDDIVKTSETQTWPPAVSVPELPRRKATDEIMEILRRRREAQDQPVKGTAK